MEFDIKIRELSDCSTKIYKPWNEIQAKTINFETEKEAEMFSKRLSFILHKEISLNKKGEQNTIHIII